MTKLSRRTALGLFLSSVGLTGCDGVGLTVGEPAPAPEPPAAPPENPRARAVRETGDAIREECRRNAGGDWVKWQELTAPYRAEVAARLGASKPFDPNGKSRFLEARGKVLLPIDDSPLVECASDNYFWYLLDPDRVARNKLEESIAAGHRWLKSRGVELVVVIAPKLIEVYPERFATACPADRVINPHVRHLLLKLAEADVDVVDLLPVMHAERETAAEPLYLPADPHWAPRGYAVGARAVAERLKRFPFVVDALAKAPIYKTEVLPFPTLEANVPLASVAAPALPPVQRARAEKAQPKTFTRVKGIDGRWAHSTYSPVMVIGNSFVSGFEEELVRALNLPIHFRANGGQSTEAYADFLREPDLLNDTKVVVWVTTTAHLAEFKPMPKPIMEAGAKV